MGARDQSEAGIQPAPRTEAAFVIERQQPCWIWREFLARNDTKQQQLIIDAVEENCMEIEKLFPTSNQG